jgi:hypothetical protein
MKPKANKNQWVKIFQLPVTITGVLTNTALQWSSTFLKTSFIKENTTEKVHKVS